MNKEMMYLLSSGFLSGKLSNPLFHSLMGPSTGRDLFVQRINLDLANGSWVLVYTAHNRCNDTIPQQI